MALAPGTQIGPYQIVDQIGSGGMGEVYRATDTKLGRDIAIKTLPGALADEPDRLARFEREAKLLATLNHAHIGAIYGLDEHEGTQFIAMELIEGQTLEEKLKDGLLPVDDALRLALQIAEALEAAHEKGVMHRDLKPANIMLTHDGVVKVLDFGLAKAFSGDPNEASPAHSPALSMAMTQQGLILGTAGYMSPEQASGQATDQRADVWAFGVVLYEMLTGLPLFSGESVPHILADVLRTEPNWNRLPKNLDPRLKVLLDRCLRKKPRDRYHAIADARIDLEEVLSDPEGLQAYIDSSTATAVRLILPWVVASVALTAAIAGLLAWTLKPVAEPRPVNRFDYDLPAGHLIRVLPGATVLALSRDGRSFAYNTNDGLYLRTLGELEPRLIPGSEDTLANPFFSADARWIGFTVGGGVMRRIPVNGGAPVDIGRVSTGISGVTWESDGSIFVADADGILRLPENGGPAELLVPADDGAVFYGPRMLPDGDTLLFSISRNRTWEDSQIVAQSISTGQRTALISGGIDARYVASGHLVYAFQDNLFAVAFDLDTLSTSRAAVPVAEGVMRTSPARGANFDISDDGTLVYMTGRIALDARTLVWVSRDGQEEAIPTPLRAFTSPRLSPDGTKVAVNLRDEEQDIWIWELERERLRRLSFDPRNDRFPAWFPNGERIAYSSASRTAASGWGLVSQAADGTGVVEQLAGAAGQLFPTSFLPDASGVLAYDDTRGNDDVVLVQFGEANIVTPLLAGEYSERTPEVSPDGRWLAYVSDESGREEVYVRPFPDVDAGRWQVSTGGGREPLWSRDGGELFYRNNDALMVVPVETGNSFAGGNPRILFEGQYFGGGAGGLGGRSYDVSADGARFLMIRSAQDSATQIQIIIVENWVEELKRLVPTE